MFEITEEKIDYTKAIERVRRKDCGAIVVFFGTSRNSSDGKKVSYLEYSAYNEMAKKEMEKIETEIGKKWDIGDIAVFHRTGIVSTGEISVVIAVSAPHRNEAFLACRYAIDRLKETVPIWKKEIME